MTTQNMGDTSPTTLQFQVLGMDNENDALEVCTQALKKLPASSARRISRYLVNRFKGTNAADDDDLPF